MQSRRKTFLTALIVGLVGATVAMVTTPAIPESCHAFREALKQQVLSESGLAGLVASAPERRLDQAIAERYAAMTADQCSAATPGITKAVEALGKTPWAARMPKAAEEANSVNTQCRDRRVSGELKSHAESAECSNPGITKAYAGIGYPYMDLVAMFEARRLEMAKEVDKSMLADTEDTMGFARIALEIAAQEAERVTKK